MADQVKVVDAVVRVSTVGLELAQQMHRVSVSSGELQEQINTFRSQLKSLDILLAASFDESGDFMDHVLENKLKEGPCSRSASINEVSFSPSYTPPFSPRMAFRNEHDDFHVGNLDLEEDRQSRAFSFESGAEFYDIGLEDKVEHSIDFDREDIPYSSVGYVQMHSAPHSRVPSMEKLSELALSSPISPSSRDFDPELSPKSQIAHSGITGLKGHLSIDRSHSRRISGCSTLQGSVHEDEEFPMRKDGSEDVIQVIEIPLKSPGRKRGSSLFGTIKKVVARN